MRRYAAILLLASTVVVDAATELKVDVYEGPKECDDSEKVSKGRYLKMHYTGTIDESSETGEKGAQFDSSRSRGQTFDFQIGIGQVIQGWDQGLIGLCKGSKANIVIPPDMGYGDSGAGGVIPGGATLHFEVEVVDISDDAPPQPPMPNIFKQIDANGDGKLTKEEVEAWFGNQGRPMPDELWDNEDKDKDGFISWDEFSGPKGDSPGGDEL